MRTVVAGGGKGAVPPVWHVTVVTFDDLPGELAACGAGPFRVASGYLRGAAEGPRGGSANRHKEFFWGWV